MFKSPLWIALAVVILFGLIQVVPYGRDHANPPVRVEPAWDSQQTRELAVRSCYDCHSNETTWPWYSNIAPVSWMLQSDVSRGRAELNFSEWDRPQEEVDEAAKTVQEGEMPQRYYVMMHPEARLSALDTQILVGGLQATLGSALGEGD